MVSGSPGIGSLQMEDLGTKENLCSDKKLCTKYTALIFDHNTELKQTVALCN